MLLLGDIAMNIAIHLARRSEDDRQIVLPTVRTALAVVAIFSIVYTWQEFFAPLIYLQRREDFPLSLGLFAFKAYRDTQWSLAMMGSLLTALPLIVLFFLSERWLTGGLTAGAEKG